jgi:predicted ATP-grasp superfamily ATP-dependent carboligase
VLEAATRLDIPVPRTTVVADASELARCRDELTFPVVVKPQRSRVRTDNGWLSTRVSYARDWDQLVVEMARRHPLEFPLLLQEKIIGSGVGVFACLIDGAPAAWFAHRRLREKPPTGGVSVLCESIALPDPARAAAERLLRALDWRGVAMVEFKEDRRDGLWKLMEVNGRFWGSLQLAIDAGVDFPVLWLNRFVGLPVPASAPYRIGVKSRWFWGDVDSLMITLRRGQGTNGQGRGRTLLDFMKMWSPQLHYENPRFSDPGPWLHESREWFGARRQVRHV